MYDRDNKERKVILVIAIIGLFIWAVTGGLLRYLYHQSSERVSGQYDVAEAEVVRKYTSRPIRGSTQYYVVGKTPDTHEESYWVRKDLYQSLDVGDGFFVYKYKEHYSSTVSGLVEDEAGTVYMIIKVINVIFVCVAISSVAAELYLIKKRKKKRRTYFYK